MIFDDMSKNYEKRQEWVSLSFSLSLSLSLTLSSSLSLPLSFSLSLSLPFVGQVSPSFSNEVFERSGVEKVPIYFQLQLNNPS